MSNAFFYPTLWKSPSLSEGVFDLFILSIFFLLLFLNETFCMIFVDVKMSTGYILYINKRMSISSAY